MPRRILDAARTMPLTILAGALLGMMLAPFGNPVQEGVLALWDQLSPVVRMEGRLVSHDETQALLHITGEKRRACIYLGINGYSRAPDGAWHDTAAQRVDAPADGRSKPVGLYDIGFWRVVLKPGATTVRVAVQHDCGGRIVTTVIAEVALPPKPPPHARVPQGALASATRPA